MKYVIRSTDDRGERIPLAVLEEKKKAARDKLLAAGMHYLEYKALLGFENAMGQPVHEEVVIIEAIGRENYV
ncbi:MAG: hypothetical protein ACLQMF_20320 [Rectinemataceae bacterium]